jgi:hypothetical protein
MERWFRWIAGGLVGLALGCPQLAAEDGPAQPSDIDAQITGSDREHWAFVPLRPTSVPSVRDLSWPLNPIDCFILTRLESEGIEPAPGVEFPALVRRMFLDVVGLPPTPDELQRMAGDARPDAVERLADALLASPEHGERWARYWLDLVRYAETNGYERDAEKPFVWRYRDWVIRAINADLPYDRFVIEQLAGDEVDDADASSIIATGYCRLGPWDDEPADPAQDRFDQLDDIVTTTSQVFLGLTLGCARCHDHKLEPLSQLDYYRMVAVFQPLTRPRDGRTELTRPAGPAARIATLAERDRRLAEIEAQLAELDSRPPVESESRARLQEEARRLRQQTPDLPDGYIFEETSLEVPATHVLRRGQASAPDMEAAPGVPAVLTTRPIEFLPAQATTRRRLTLARWIASPENPLAARVLVNRIWQRYFGNSLVPTPSDFGLAGEPPSHPELLDWLAWWFIHEADWSVKRLERLILTSRTYRQSKQGSADSHRKDPANELLSRQTSRRLEIEALRDSILAASGRLNREMFGPSAHLHVPRDALLGNSDPDKIWPAYDEREGSRRTVYAYVKRSMVVPLLEVCDLCDTTRSSAVRNVTHVPSQALTLFNSEFVNAQAGHFADRLIREADAAAEARVTLAFQLALARSPTAAELVAMTRFLQSEAARLADAMPAEEEDVSSRCEREALVQLCRVIFNLNEFAYSE